MTSKTGAPVVPPVVVKDVPATFAGPFNQETGTNLDLYFQKQKTGLEVKLQKNPVRRIVVPL